MKKNYLVGYKTFFALLGFSAIVTEIATLVAVDLFNPSHFFSFFTIQSNIIACIVFLLSAFVTYAGKKSARLDFARGASTVFMIVTGIVFAVLLADSNNAHLTAVPWDNTVLHYLIPVAVAIDWLMDPPVRRIHYRKALLWLIFPIAYLGYSLLRGPLVGWYPYPFLNPAHGGYGHIAITSLIIAAGGVLLVYIVTRFAKVTTKK